MKLWLLRPIEGLNENPWERWYDKNFGFVIRAKTEADAREMANVNAGDEKDTCRDIWKNPNYSTCVELSKTGEAEIIIADYRSA